jgi:DNA-binding PucR family transcriptional regulator
MEQDLVWFSTLSAQDRSWVGLIVQSGIRSFVEWYDEEPAPGAGQDPDLAASIFGAAPRALAGVITLQQTVDLVRLSVDVVEHSIEELLDAEELPAVRQGISRYAREIAFATAEVYAHAAEVRGAWDARLEALVVDAVLRAEADEDLLSRASALGWARRGSVAVVLGTVPERRTETDVFAAIRRVAQVAGLDALCATQGDRLVVLLGGVDDERAAATVVLDQFGPGPVVVGPVAAELGDAHVSARAALAGLRAAPGWPDAPRPALSDELVPERVLAGDGHARRHLVDHVYAPLTEGRGELTQTLNAWFDNGGSVEATARALFVHANTVRYRLRQVAEVTGLAPTDPRDALSLRLALVLGRLSSPSVRS